MDSGSGIFSQLLHALRPTPCLAMPSEKCVSGHALVTRLLSVGRVCSQGKGCSLRVRMGVESRRAKPTSHSRLSTL